MSLKNPDIAHEDRSVARGDGRPAGFPEPPAATGQHYDDAMSEAFFHDLVSGIPDTDLKVGSPGVMGARPRPCWSASRPSSSSGPRTLVVVVGDVNSTFAAALAATKLSSGIAVAHVEAGLGSGRPKYARRGEPDPHGSDREVCLTHSADALSAYQEARTRLPNGRCPELWDGRTAERIVTRSENGGRRGDRRGGWRWGVAAARVRPFRPPARGALREDGR